MFSFNQSIVCIACFKWTIVSTAKVKKQLFGSFMFDVGKVKRGAFAAGRKITRIISFSKKKPPRPGDPRTSNSDPRQGCTPLHFHYHSVVFFFKNAVVSFVISSSPCRLPVTAGEPGVAGTVVLCEQRLSALLPWQRRLSDLPASAPSPRLWGRPGAGTQTSLCLPNLTEQHRGGCFGGEI